MIEEEKIEAVVPAQEQESVVATVEPEQNQPMEEEVDVSNIDTSFFKD